MTTTRRRLFSKGTAGFKRAPKAASKVTERPQLAFDEPEPGQPF